jgi:adenosine deaminase/adenosine deaminase CECR1
VAIEINLVNEFILKVKENHFAIQSIWVPSVISTDDAGILRTNMTEQYVLLAIDKDVSYTDIKAVCTIVLITALLRKKGEETINKGP